MDSIQDANLRNLLVELLNVNEEQGELISAQAEMIQSLQDEINRLKGEQGKPKFNKSNKGANKSISSEQERKQNKQWQKEGKKDNLAIDREVKIELSTEELAQLPSDTRFLRYETYIQQDLKLVRENTRYIVAIYYSASTGKTYRTKLPEDYQGYFGSNLKTLIHVLTHVCDVTHSKLLELFRSSGIEISSGSLNNILHSQAPMYESEQSAILQAGLSTRYSGMDSTGSKQKGERLYTQIINNELYSIFSSRKRKSRLAVLSVLQGREPPELPMSYNWEAKKLLNDFGLAHQDKISVDKLFEHNKVYTQAEVKQLITDQLPCLKAKKNMFHRLLEALAIAHYHQQSDYPKLEHLISDDAGEYKKIAVQSHALCWVHDARAYKKLTPRIQAHGQILKDFLEIYWKYYHKLVDYKSNPDEKKAKLLAEKFEAIFTTRTDYFQLNQRIEKTYANKDKLLAVLNNPFIPLHNNASELAARRVVTKRNISLHTVTDEGTKVRDAAMSIIETAKKLKVNVIDYLNDRISGNYQMPALADMILSK